MEARHCLSILAVACALIALATPGHAMPLGDPTVNLAGVVDGWVSNLVIDEGRSHTNDTPWPETLSIDSFTYAVGANRSRVTPFVVRLNDLNSNGNTTDDNNFTILKLGTTRVSGVDYASTGVFSQPFDAAGPVSVTLNPGETIAAAFLDANADGTGGEAGSVIPMNGTVPAGSQWYNGAGSAPHPSPAPLSEGQTFGGSPAAGVENRNYEFNVDVSIPPQTIEIAGDNVIGIDVLPGVEHLSILPVVVTGAKSIRLVQNYSDTFQIAEIMAHEDGTLANVALQGNGGLASASSAGYGTSAGLVNDGDLNGAHPHEWHSTESIGAWVQVDFANPTDLSSAHVYGRTDACQYRQNDFDVVLYDASGTEIHRQRVLGLGDEPGQHRLFDFEILSGGEAVATLTQANTYVFEILGATADQLVVPNPDPTAFITVLDLNQATIAVEAAGGSFNIGDSWDLFDADEIRGDIGELHLPPIGPHLYLDASTLLSDGTVSVAVPEPTTLILTGIGLAGCALRRRRRRA